MSRLLQCFRENSHFSGGLSILTADQFVFFTVSILICLPYITNSFPQNFNVSDSEQESFWANQLSQKIGALLSDASDES